MLLKNRLTWFIGIATLLSFVGVTIFSLITPSTRDTELVRFAGLNSIRRSELTAELQRCRKKFGNISPSDCLDVLVTERMVEGFCQEHHMDCSNEVIINLLKGLPYFWTEGKGFDQSKFDNYLKSESANSEDPIVRAKKDLLCRFALSVFSESCLSNYLANALSTNGTSSRDIIVAHCDVEKVPPPSESELLATYAKHKKEFYVPELRFVKYFTVNRTTSVSDAEIHAYIAKNSPNGVPLNSNNKAAAKIVAAEKDRSKLAKLRSCISELVSEQDFEKLAKKFASKVSLLEEASFLDLSQSEVFSPFAREVFSTEAKAFADPSVTEEKFVIWYVSDIFPPRSLNFEDSKHLVAKKCIESKKHALSIQKAVNLHSKLKGSKVTAQRFIKESNAIGAQLKSFESINSSSKTLSAHLLKTILGLRHEEVSSAAFDSATGKTYVVFVKKLKKCPKSQDVAVSKEALKRSMFFEIQSYFIRKYKPTMVNSVAD